MTIDRTSADPPPMGRGAAAAAVVLIAVLSVLGAPSSAAASAPAWGQAPVASATRAAVNATTAAGCAPGQSGAAIPTMSSGRAAVRTTIGVAKALGVPEQGQIIAVMVMFQESSIRNLANDGTSVQGASWPSPGRDYWMRVTRLSLKYPHDRFGARDGAHDTDSIGLYQQRPSAGWGNYGNSSGTTDPEGVVQRLLDPRWEAMAFFGGPGSAAPTAGLLDVPGWQAMPLTTAADAVQQSSHPDYYAQWEAPATTYVVNNQDAPAITLPWYPGGGGGALACTSIPTNPALGEVGRNPIGALDDVRIDGTSIRVAGWMLDPDAVNGIGSVHFTDAGPFGTSQDNSGLATRPRSDVDRVYNVMGDYGFVDTLAWTGAGRHTICAVGVNVGRGTGDSRLGCRRITVPGPVGALDLARQAASGQIDLAGWAADPAAPGAQVKVNAYVSGPKGRFGYGGIYTGDARPDVQRARPWTGPVSGFHATVPNAGIGENNVCIYAINVHPPNTNPRVACRKVRIFGPPVGSIDELAVSGNSVHVAGWAFDPSAPATSIRVHIYVTPRPPGTAVSIPTDQVRTDVNRVYGISGVHGYAKTVALRPGVNRVCVYAIGVIPGNNLLIGCRPVQPAPTVTPAAATVPSTTTAAGTTANGTTANGTAASGTRVTGTKVTGTPTTTPAQTTVEITREPAPTAVTRTAAPRTAATRTAAPREMTAPRDTAPRDTATAGATAPTGGTPPAATSAAAAVRTTGAPPPSAPDQARPDSSDGVTGIRLSPPRDPHATQDAR